MRGRFLFPSFYARKRYGLHSNKNITPPWGWQGALFAFAPLDFWDERVVFYARIEHSVQVKKDSERQQRRGPKELAVLVIRRC